MAEPKHRERSDSPSRSEMALCARKLGRGCSLVCPRTVTETSTSFRGRREPAGRCASSARRVLLAAFVMAVHVSCPGASTPAQVTSRAVPSPCRPAPPACTCFVVPMGGGRGRASAVGTPGGSGGGMQASSSELRHLHLPRSPETRPSHLTCCRANRHIQDSDGRMRLAQLRHASAGPECVDAVGAER